MGVGVGGGWFIKFRKRPVNRFKKFDSTVTLKQTRLNAYSAKKLDNGPEARRRPRERPDRSAAKARSRTTIVKGKCYSIYQFFILIWRRSASPDDHMIAGELTDAVTSVRSDRQQPEAIWWPRVRDNGLHTFESFDRGRVAIWANFGRGDRSLGSVDVCVSDDFMNNSRKPEFGEKIPAHVSRNRKVLKIINVYL